MRNLAFKTVFILSISVLLFACKKDKSGPETVDIYIDFWNPDGVSPKVKFDETQTSSKVKIDFDKPFEGIAVDAENAQVLIDNFRIIDDNYKNYTISKITAYEKNDLGEWIEQLETELKYTKTVGLSAVLVIDRSGSLGDDFVKVQEYAVEFINQLFEQTKNKARIGIVDFATDVKSFPISNNKADIIAYINSLENGGYTTFYKAVDLAIDMLLVETNAESKAILSFTDGADDTQDPLITSTYLRDKLINDDSEKKISSFTIGFGSQVSETPLRNISVNGGMYQLPKSTSELQTVFNNFSTAIANVYNLNYIRRQSVIPEDNPAKLKFAITTE
jgi:hypothetical protein